MSSKKATPRRKTKPPIAKATVSTVGKERHEKNGTIASYSFVPDDEVQEIIRDVEKFSIRRSKIEDNGESDEETDDSTAMFGKYYRQAHRVGRGKELKGSQVFGFKTPKPGGRKMATPIVGDPAESVDEPRPSRAIAKEKDGADAYFEAHGDDTSAAATSDRTLSRLKTPRLSQETLDKLLAAEPVRYEKEMLALFDGYRDQFERWLQLLSEGFNIVLFGLGSKKSLLEEFRTGPLDGEDCVVVNGFFPSLTTKHILNSLTKDLFEHDGTFSSVVEQVEFIRQELNSVGRRGRVIYLVVHNIDGPNLRGEKAQGMLAQLVAIPAIHLVCSIDHINAPLLWDQQKLSKFNFVWFDATTFMPYSEETRNENSFMVKQSGTLALNSLNHVFASLTPNAKDIYLMIAQYQIDSLHEQEVVDKDNEETAYRGIAFNDLYRKCKGAFLVNSDLTLRAQLIEFRDHKLINVKKGQDGYDYLTIPLNSSTLKEFLEDHRECQ